MVRSMTGFGRGECSMYDRRVVVEVKSVNHRYNDISIKMPKFLNPLEDIVRKRVLAEISRGKTDVFITVDSVSQDDVKIVFNQAIADLYVAELHKIVTRYGLDGNIPIDLVAGFPELFSLQKTPDDSKLETEVLEVLVNALGIALDQFMKMRIAEGMALKKNILIKTNYIQSQVDIISKRAPLVADEYAQRLSLRIADTLSKVDIVVADEARLLTEIAIFADKSSIDEEITRLFSHISQFEQTLDENDSIGRKLDFLIQEMNREINTISSKSGDLSITKVAIEIKGELEKIREQVQNIE